MTDVVDRARDWLDASGDGRIATAQAKELARSAPIEEVMLALIELAAERAQPAVSNYKVGAIGQGASGALYLGANFEFARTALQQTVHAEQCVTANAAAHGETGLVRLAVTAPPCGHCRQFLYELASANRLEILLADERPARIAHFLPDAFGPGDLGIEGGLLEPQSHGLAPVDGTSGDDALATAAIAAANGCYAPYSKAYGGAAIETGSGDVFAGGYLENAAFNPSLPPFQSAYASAMLAGHGPGDIARVAIAQLPDSHVDHHTAAKVLLLKIAPAAGVDLIALRESP